LPTSHLDATNHRKQVSLNYFDFVAVMCDSRVQHIQCIGNAAVCDNKDAVIQNEGKANCQAGLQLQLSNCVEVTSVRQPLVDERSDAGPSVVKQAVSVQR